MIPERWAEYYLSNAPSLVWLLVANVAAVLVGVRYYVETMPAVDTFAWPLYADSPTAVFVATLSIATLLPNLGRRLRDAPTNLPLAYLHTLAFALLVKYGLWTVLALNLRVSLYFPEVWAYFGIILTHLAFVGEAYLIPHYGKTTRGALAFALVVMLVGDFVDYGLGATFGCVLGSPEGRCSIYPPLRYEPELLLPALTVLTTVLTVWLAARAFDHYPAPDGR
ncbi:DUF1405 domain-containing protein [Halomarina oriensis]|uniref:DUF1405 domain-containing protein n=1 Tax=Halomarina oriensis TaxID=671145 RepID=A0A6B0GMD4_9EURY|nr:DUF1405 domain-containing protein [Halomarina oriensis]MWG35081.1 DUF1405 domain-containing protein [Halomarina oriensis]